MQGLSPGSGTGDRAGTGARTKSGLVHGIGARTGAMTDAGIGTGTGAWTSAGIGSDGAELVQGCKDWCMDCRRD